MARQAQALLGGGAIAISTVGISDLLALSLNPNSRPGSYRLVIAPTGITLEAECAGAACHGLQTLAQIRQQSPVGSLPALSIDDWPDFTYRGIYYDLARGRVPTLARLKELAELLAHYKINELQLYIEHTFRFRRHPEIGKDASPLKRGRYPGIGRLLPGARRRAGAVALQLRSLIAHPQPARLPPPGGRLGEGKYLDPEARDAWTTGWSLAAANEESYIFLRQLFDEFLPCFSSKRFNVCCDENYDLGWGQSYELARKIGRGRLYLNHLLRLREMAAAHGKQVMFWGDIIRHYPELIPDIPRDVTVLDWGYWWRENFDRIKDFTATGLPSYGCPSVCGYVTLFPRIHEAAANIAGWAQGARRHGAVGILSTDWGDGGHYNFMECAWPGYLFSAEQSWNADADIASFYARFARLFLGITAPVFAEALIELGDVAQTSAEGFYQSLWRHVYFAAPGDEVLLPQERVANTSVDGVIHEGPLKIDAALGRAEHARLQRVKEVFTTCAQAPGTDPHGVLPYWFFALDTLLHATRKLAVLGEGGEDNPANREALATELETLCERFQTLWHARNRPSEISITLGYYQHALAGLRAVAAE